MAHIEIIQTGEVVETHIRGRVFRYRKMKSHGKWPKPVKKSKEKRLVCVLNADVAMKLEQMRVPAICYGPAANHTHYTREAIAPMIVTGELRWVEGSGNNVAAQTSEVHWEPRNQAMQLLPGNASKPGHNQHVQKMRKISTAMGTNVAMRNDGRIE